MHDAPIHKKHQQKKIEHYSKAITNGIGVRSIYIFTDTPMTMIIVF